MRLILRAVPRARLAAVINIHDVALAQMFVPRIVGLRAGRVVFDGPPDGLTPDVLTEIYGEEDWTADHPRRRRRGADGDDQARAIAAKLPSRTAHRKL
jgi:phosphonate transport system ATP-binding protein